MTKPFARLQRRERISDERLCTAIPDAEAGLIEAVFIEAVFIEAGLIAVGLIAADLGGGLIKQRVARPGAGKRGDDRTVIA